MSKSDRLARIIEIYLEGDLELNTAAAELVHVYIARGWRFSLVTADCEPRFRTRMRTLALRVDAAVLARQEALGRAPAAIPPIIIR
jgi:hypothetical protein